MAPPIGASSRPSAPSPPTFASDPDYLGPISATPQKMVEEMLCMANVGTTDVVFDLGCNDGRVCITAARAHGARAVGVEIDAGAVVKAKRLAKEAGVEHLVRLERGNAVRARLAGATVVCVYLLPTGNRKISRKLMRELPAGTVVMTYVFRLPAEEWDAHLEDTRAVASTRDRATPGLDASSYNKIFMYRVPKVKPAWCQSSGGGEGGVRLLAAAVAAAGCFLFLAIKHNSEGAGKSKNGASANNKLFWG